MSDSPVLLNYSITTYPYPLQTSRVYPESFGTLNIVVAPPRDQVVYVKEILVYVPSYVLSENNKFTMAVDDSNWKYTAPYFTDGGRYTVILFSLKSAQYCELNYPITFTIGIRNLTQKVGEVNGLKIIENSSEKNPSEHPNEAEQRTKQFSVVVGQTPFYIHSFVAQRYDILAQEGISNGGFNYGEPIRLNWEGNATNYKVIAFPDGVCIFEGADTSVILPDGLKQTTTFVLEAIRTSGKSDQKLYLYRNLTVNIVNSVATVDTINVSGDIKTIGGDMYIARDTELKGNTNIGGNLTVSGTTILSNTSVHGVLNVDRTAILADTNVLGELAVKSAVSMMGNASMIEPGVYTAHTDGVVIGVVDYYGDPDKKVIGRIFGSTALISVGATGGNSVYNVKDEGVHYSNITNSFFMPVKKGNDYSVGIKYGRDNEDNPITKFYWIPLGVASEDAI